MEGRDDRALTEREKKLAMAELELEQERRAFVLEKEDHAKRRGWRDNLYGRINVSIKTVDVFIIGVSVLLLAAIVVGILL